MASCCLLLEAMPFAPFVASLLLVVMPGDTFVASLLSIDIRITLVSKLPSFTPVPQTVRRTMCRLSASHSCHKLCLSSSSALVIKSFKGGEGALSQTKTPDLNSHMSVHMSCSSCSMPMWRHLLHVVNVCLNLIHGLEHQSSLVTELSAPSSLVRFVENLS